MKKISITIGLLIILTAGVLMVSSNTPVADTVLPTPTPAPINGDILSSKVNDYRVENGLPSLPEEESLCQYAEERAEEIKTDWSHDQFYQDQCSGLNYGFCGENLAKEYRTETQTLLGWKHSPTHDENIKRTWSAMCIRCSGHYCAQIFGI